MASKKLSLLAIFTLLLALFSALAHAAVIEAVGIAPIDAGGLEQARKAAIRDATRQAAIQAGADVQMSETVSADGQPLQSSRVRAPKEFASVTVVREWREGDFLHVLVRADDSALREQNGGVRAYKKKILAAQFTVNQPRQLQDVDDIWNGFPRELMRRLDDSKRILPRLLGRPIFTDPQQLNTDPTRLAVRQAAEQNDAQFVISGTVLDASVGKEGGYWGYFKNDIRRFEVEVFVHDGLTGALVAQHRLATSAAGEFKIARGVPFGSTAFFVSDYGHSIDGLIDDMAKLILADLERLPFAAKIVRVAGAKVFVDAGATSSLQTGDTMVVYQLKRDQVLSALRNGAEIGVPEVPLTTVAISQVQPLFASGDIQGDPKVLKVQVGDLVRFETQK